MKVCTTCQRKSRLAQWHLDNPGKKLEANRRWSALNKEKDKQIKADWQKRNPVKIAEKSARWRAANPEKAKEIVKRRYWNNREKIIRDVVERNAKYRTPLWADLNKIAEIYSECRAVTANTGIQHHVDHIVPIKGKYVCGLHVETNLRVIDAVTNIRKFNHFEGNP